MKHASLVLAFDIGTSSLRTTLFTTAGKRLVETTVQKKYPLRHTQDGGAELLPNVLRKAARDALGETMEVYRKDKKLRGVPILGVGTSAFWHSLIGLGENNKPVTPVITWADSRCRSDAAKLRDELGERETHARTGCMVRTSFWPAKLVWLRRTEPKLFSQVRKWMSPAEWLYQEFLGTDVHCSFSMASGMGLFNAHTLSWDEALLKRCGLNENSLNPISEVSNAVESGGIIRQFPELKNVPWFPAIGDGAASNLGSGATHVGLAAINVGTSAALRVMRSGGIAQAPFGLFCYRVDHHRYLIGGAVSNAGNLRAWCVRELRLDESQIEREMQKRPAPDHGLTVLPFWSAERAPTWEEERRGSIHGITHNTTALDMLQAITEASYFRIARIAELVLEEEKEAPKFIVSGGIQRSRSSLQRVADVLNQPVYPNDEPEASIRGAAIYVLEKLGFNLPPLELTRPIQPREQYAARYAQERQRQSELENLTSGC